MTSPLSPPTPTRTSRCTATNSACDYAAVHHIAFRVPNQDQYQASYKKLEGEGIRNCGSVDRVYFRSLYFREPNGNWFELATDGPGSSIDKDAAHLAEQLALPPFLESHQTQIEFGLIPLQT